MSGTTVHGLTFPVATTDPVVNYPAQEQTDYGILDATARGVWFVGGAMWHTENAKYNTGAAQWQYWNNGRAVAFKFVFSTGAGALGKIETYYAADGVAGNPITWLGPQFVIDVTNGAILFPKLAAAPAAPVAGFLGLYLVPGTLTGVSLRCKGSVGTEVIIIDDIPGA
jgi:hypothetical protein